MEKKRDIIINVTSLNSVHKRKCGFLVYDGESQTLITLTANNAEELAKEYCAPVEEYVPYFDLIVGQSFTYENNDVKVTRIW